MAANLQKFTRPNFTSLTAALVAAAVIGLAYVGTQAAHRTIAGPRLYLDPAKASYSVGQTLTVDVREDSGTSAVNAVQANLTYPADKLSFVSVDTSGSGFGVAAQGDDKGGIVAIARGSVSPLTGNQLVARVTFKITGKGTVPMSFATGSALVSSESNSNILAGTTGGSYRVR